MMGLIIHGVSINITVHKACCPFHIRLADEDRHPLSLCREQLQDHIFAVCGLCEHGHPGLL